jgi:hypothetical protein
MNREQAILNECRFVSLTLGNGILFSAGITLGGHSLIKAHYVARTFQSDVSATLLQDQRILQVNMFALLQSVKLTF